MRGGGAQSLCPRAMGNREVVPGRSTNKKASSQEEKGESEKEEYHPE